MTFSVHTVFFFDTQSTSRHENIRFGSMIKTAFADALQRTLSSRAVRRVCIKFIARDSQYRVDIFMPSYETILYKDDLDALRWQLVQALLEDFPDLKQRTEIYLKRKPGIRASNKGAKDPLYLIRYE